MNPVLFEPIYQERVWGGRRLESSLGRKLPPGKVIGESWDVVDRADENSPLREPLEGATTLRTLIEKYPGQVMGEGWDPTRRFPILVKWLDCRQRLSLQVHPPAPVAKTLGGEPKTENWFVAESEPGSGLIVGLKHGVSREEFEEALRSERLEECVHRFPVEPGDSILVESGRIHAIDAGNLILEIQQNSDTTFRVYDWGRVGLDGKPRQLHVDESMQCIDFDDFEPSAASSWNEPGTIAIAECSEFRIRRSNQDAGGGLPLERDGCPSLVHIVSGSLRDHASGISFSRGDTALLPASGNAGIFAVEPSTVLITDRFA